VSILGFTAGAFLGGVELFLVPLKKLKEHSRVTIKRENSQGDGPPRARGPASSGA